jgi:hypothetical protein
MSDTSAEFLLEDLVASSAQAGPAVIPIVLVRPRDPLDAPPVAGVGSGEAGRGGSNGETGGRKDGKGSDGSPGLNGSAGPSGDAGGDGKDGPDVELQLDDTGAVRVLSASAPLQSFDDPSGARGRVVVMARGGAGGRGGMGGIGGRGGSGGDGGRGEPAPDGSRRHGRDGGDGGRGGAGGRGGNGGRGGDGGRGGRVIISAASTEALLAIAGVDVAGGSGGAGGIAGSGAWGGPGGRGGNGSKGAKKVKDGAIIWGERERDGRDGSAGEDGERGSDGIGGARGRDGPRGSLEVRIGSGNSVIHSDRIYSAVVRVEVRGPSGLIAKVESCSALEECRGTAVPRAADAVARLRVGSSVEILCRVLVDGPAPVPVPIRFECMLEGCPSQELGVAQPASDSVDVGDVNGRFTVPLGAPIGRRRLVVRAVAVSSMAAWQVLCEAQVEILPIARVFAVRMRDAVLACDDSLPVDVLVEASPGSCMGWPGVAVGRLQIAVRGTIGGSPESSAVPAVVPVDSPDPGGFHAARVQIPLRTALDTPLAGHGDGPLEACDPQTVTLDVGIASGHSPSECHRWRIVVPLILEAPLEVVGKCPAPVLGFPFVMQFRHRASTGQWREWRAPGNATGTGGISVGDPWPQPDEPPGSTPRRSIVAAEARARFSDGTSVVGKVALRQSARAPVAVGFGGSLFAGKLSGTGQRPASPVVELRLGFGGDQPERRLACRYRVPPPQVGLDVDEVIVQPGCPSGDIRVGIRLAPRPESAAEDCSARGLAIRLVLPAGILRDGGTSWTLPHPVPAVGPDGLVECRLPVSRANAGFSMAVATVSGKAGVYRKRLVRVERPGPSLDLAEGKLSERMWEPCELQLRLRRHPDLAPDYDRSMIAVRVRSMAMALDGHRGDWVQARHLRTAGDDELFMLGIAGDVVNGGVAALDIEIVEGETTSGRWQASVSRIPPPSRRLLEAKYALLGGVVFAQKFKFASSIVAVAGLVVTVVSKFPVGVVIGVAEAGMLLLMSDASYLRRRQRPGRWW